MLTKPNQPILLLPKMTDTKKNLRRSSSRPNGAKSASSANFGVKFWDQVAHVNNFLKSAIMFKCRI
jgi:hypothetical protein